MDLKGKTVVLGVTGGIAAYWAAEIIGVFRGREADVHVIMTENAGRFITPLTLQTISKNKVVTNMFELPADSDIGHITYAKKADLILVAPATANFIGKVASGIADDILTTTIMAAKSPVFIAPAMNENMWKNNIVQRNIATLKQEGYKIINPGYGKMACGGEGEGTLASIKKILKEIEEL
ncbi:MAG: bifunctional phosphopantothenoylcysteine decarboxylase/phosphopantothenate--cysteine ligase CoaBC [Candidatus Nealsonbacteria bacterium]|nr:bifunctional phosphopantothenoylcysteine decarboxylase/phosphopantothenate--cysteine ligase CoaBC [Candidatus Nealsonbacteria bacterium]